MMTMVSMRVIRFVFLCAATTAALVGQTSYNVTFYGSIDPYTGGANGADYSEVWGWTDTVSEKEYAFIGTSKGTSVVDISSLPLKETALLPGPPSGYNYHEFRTFGHHLYVGAEGTDPAKRPGIQIHDLSTLPDSVTFVKTYTWKDTTTSVQSYLRAHTLTIDGHFLYANGGDFGGTRIMDISDPVNPLQVGSYGKGSTPYVHDAYVRNDTLYAAAINAGQLDIVDLTVKGHYTQNTASKVVSMVPTVPEGRTHQVWLSDDGRTMFVATEAPSATITNPYKLHIYDITNRNAPVEIASWVSSATASIHNVFVKGNFLYIAYYGDGFRVLDVSNPANPIEVAFYDTYPGPRKSGDHPVFHGAWGVYPYFPSGKVAVSDMNTGLYVLTVNEKPGGSVVGIVRDALTNAPLSGVTVTVLETGRIQTTTATGIYRYGTAAGTHSVLFAKSGYTADTLSIVTKAGTTDTVYVLLAPSVTHAGGSDIPLPGSFHLEQNMPNPFNPSTTIGYTLAAAQFVDLSVYDLLGRRIATLVQAQRPAGRHVETFSAASIPSGVYLYTLTAGPYTRTRKMVVTR